MGRKATRNMWSGNTNKNGIQYICWFYSQGVCYDSRSYDRKIDCLLSCSSALAIAKRCSIDKSSIAVNEMWQHKCNKQYLRRLSEQSRTTNVTLGTVSRLGAEI